jgi:hypothetical protein
MNRDKLWPLPRCTEIKAVEFGSIGLEWYFEWYPYIPSGWLRVDVQAFTKDALRHPFLIHITVLRATMIIRRKKKA